MGVGAAAVRPGNGLTGMRERIEALGGSMQLQTGRSEGFTIIVKLPSRESAP